MKKLILGSGLLVLVIVTVFSISTSRSLKASDELTESTSSQISSETTVPSEPITDLPPEVLPVEPVQEVRASDLPAETETISSETQVTEETSVSEETSSSESSMEESSTETSTTTSSEPTTETSTTSSTSTTETSTSQSQTEESSSTSSSSQESISSSESTTEASTEPPVEEPTPEPEATPASPPATSEPAIASFPAQSSVVVPAAPLPTIGSSNPLGNREVELDERLRVSQVAESDFNGYELPQLSSFSDPKQGVLIYEGLKQLGEKEAAYTVQEFVEGLFGQLFNESLAEESLQAIEEKDLQPGDILIEDTRIIGLYLGEDHYLTVQEKEVAALEEDTEETKQSTEEISTDEKETTQEVVIAHLSEREDESRSGKRPKKLVKTAYAEEVEKDYPASFAIEANDQTQQFIDQIAVDAQKLGLKYDVFASVMIAQAILESGSGTSGLSVAPNYNLFGVKGSYGGQSVSLPTQEDRGNGEFYTISAAFRRYPSYAESLGDYVSLIREGISGNEAYYQEVWRSESKNYLRAAQALTGKYATDTSYHKKISSIIAAYHLTVYDEPLPESGSTSAILQGKESIPAEYRKKMKLPDYDGKNYNLSGSYPVGQCTWYAFNRVTQLGGRVDDFMGNGGEWGTKGRALGYEVTQTPKAGYLISFTPGTAGSDPRYGHVAFVEAVTDEGILISEGNVVGGTTISYRVISNDLAKSNLVSYIKPK